jgi:hypothetical protein
MTRQWGSDNDWTQGHRAATDSARVRVNLYPQPWHPGTADFLTKEKVMKPKDMLTYRSPRSLNDAFPHSAEYGAAIERPCETFQQQERVVVWACAAAVVALVLMAAWGWL